MQTMVVGQRIQLTVSSTSGRTLSNIQWTPSGTDVVESYIYGNSLLEKEAAVPKKLSPTELHKADIAFYWFHGGPHTVTVAANDGSERLETKVPYNVLAPSRVDMTAPVTGDVVAGPTGFPGDPSLRFGIREHPGIKWTFSATAPQGGNGKIAAVQVVDTMRNWQCHDGSIQQVSSGGKYLLDIRENSRTPFYRDLPVNITAARRATWNSQDSPGQLLLSNMKGESARDSFVIYFMYRSDKPGSIWVSLGWLYWYWAGQTTIANPQMNTWYPVPSNKQTHSRAPVKGTTLPGDLPEWHGNVIPLINTRLTCPPS